MPATTGFTPLNRTALKAREKTEKFKMLSVSKNWKKTSKLLTTSGKDYNKACLKTNIPTSSETQSCRRAFLGYSHYCFWYLESSSNCLHSSNQLCMLLGWLKKGSFLRYPPQSTWNTVLNKPQVWLNSSSRRFRKKKSPKIQDSRW